MTDVIYFPATPLDMFNRNIKSYEPILNFWDDNSYFKHNNLLISSYYALNKYNGTSNDSLFDKLHFNGRRFMDSGGYQVWTKGISMDPRTVIHLYEREHCELGFVLDIPGPNPTQKIVSEVKSNIQLQLDEQNNVGNTTKLLNVVHGSTYNSISNYLEEFKYFDNEISGYAMGVKPTINTVLQALTFLITYEKFDLRNKNVHFLGVSGFDTIPILVYLAKSFQVREFTIDSTSYAELARNRKIYNPMYPKNFLMVGDTLTSGLSKLPCECPVCRNIDINLMKNEPLFGSLHNLYIMKKYIDFFNSFKSKEYLRSYILTTAILPKKTKDAVNFIDESLESGDIISSMEKYSEYIKISNNNNTNTSLVKFN